MRRFEFQDAKSHKFWEIQFEGETYTVRYGRMGTDGQTSTKVFKDAAEAERKGEAAVKSKLKKGYVEVVAKVAADPLEAIRERLYANPEDAEAWAVLADQLQAAGDARGELVAVQRALASAPSDALKAQEQALLAEHGAALLGDIRPDRPEAEAIELDWANGYWRRVKVFITWDTEDLDGPKLLSWVLRHPSAAFLEELEIGMLECDGEAEFGEAVQILVKNGVRPSLRKLHIGAFEYPEDTEISWTYHKSVERLGPLLPNLQELVITGGSIELGQLKAPRLKRLKLETGGLPSEPAVYLGKASFPELVDLEVWFGTEDYEGACSVEHAAAILGNTAGFPKLRRLGLKNADFQAEIVGVLADGALLPQLTHLDLSMGILTDEQAQPLLDHMAKLAHLQVLDVHESFLSDGCVAALKAAFPGELIAHEQREDDGDWYYTAVGE